VNVTVTLGTGLPPLSVTVACNDANAVLIGTLCGVPLEATTFAGDPAVFVRLNVAVPTTPDTLATTV
jgi:hypothetical protein